MKKILAGLIISLLSTSVIASADKSSNIDIPVQNGGIVSPMGGKLTVKVSGIILDDVLYDISCQMNNPNMPEHLSVKLSRQNTYCPTMNGCGGLMVNGNYVSSSQVNLDKDVNTIKFMKLMTASHDKEGAIIFQNLDTTAHAAVSKCVASPSV